MNCKNTRLDVSNAYDYDLSNFFGEDERCWTDTDYSHSTNHLFLNKNIIVVPQMFDDVM